jgi:trk system potassium uptake protein TrkA
MKIIIIGCGRVGCGLAEALTLQRHSVTVIDRDPATFERLGPHFVGRTITGIGFDREVLLDAGIERADGLAAVTETDETNAVIARIAHLVFRVPRVVARLYDPRKADIYRRLGVQTIAPVPWGVERMAEMLTYSAMGETRALGTGGVEVIELEVPSHLVGHTVRELTVPGEIQVIAVSRTNETFIPSPGTIFRDRDVLHLTVAAGATGQLRDLLGYA